MMRADESGGRRWWRICSTRGDCARPWPRWRLWPRRRRSWRSCRRPRRPAPVPCPIMACRFRRRRSSPIRSHPSPRRRSRAPVTAASRFSAASWAPPPAASSRRRSATTTAESTPARQCSASLPAPWSARPWRRATARTIESRAESRCCRDSIRTRLPRFPPNRRPALLQAGLGFLISGAAQSGSGMENAAMTAEKRSFEAEVSRLLEIVAHSLYSEREVFLRELISNASDACDRLRYLALTQPELVAGDAAYRITLAADSTARTLTVADNGIGMNRAELIDNLGTIARSGTSAFVKNLSGDQRKDVALIGQFGVGFYSAFMVAGEVEVVSRKAGAAEAWRWVSDGKGEFSVEEASKGGRGTTITMHLHEADAEYADPQRLEGIVRTYSDHIALPIVLEAMGKKERLTRAAALWMRPRAEITEDQYREFYHHVGHGFDEPWLTLHAKAEGTYEYTSLLFV